MIIKIPYHNKYLNCEIPEKNIGTYNAYKETATENSNRSYLEKIFAEIPASKLEDIISNKNLIMIIEDSSRDVPNEDKLNIILPRLHAAAGITVIIGTGTHESETRENLQIKKTLKRIADYHKIQIKNIFIHDCMESDFYPAGITSGKNRIYVNKIIKNADVFLAFSDIKNHYFAGYSNPLKQFLPAICRFDSIERNHALALDEKSTFGRHPLHPDLQRRDNPLARDMLEAFHLITGERPALAFATISVNNKILWARCGDLKEITASGLLEADKIMSVKAKPADYLIVSSGGYPNDISLYHAQRALELTRNAVKENGEILFVAGCSGGIGTKKSVENFYHPLTEQIENILAGTPEEYKMFAHKTYKFASLIKKCKKIYVFSELPEKDLEAIHLKKIDEVQQKINDWIKSDANAVINIFTQGNKVAVYSDAL